MHQIATPIATPSATTSPHALPIMLNEEQPIEAMGNDVAAGMQFQLQAIQTNRSKQPQASQQPTNRQPPNH